MTGFAATAAAACSPTATPGHDFFYSDSVDETQRDAADATSLRVLLAYVGVCGYYQRGISGWLAVCFIVCDCQVILIVDWL